MRCFNEDRQRDNRQAESMSVNQSDFLVIGSGLAGLAFALKSADLGKVIIVTKDKAPSANTTWAQGGIAAVMSKDDSFSAHIQDTLRAGAGLCKADIVRNFIEQAPERINDLINWGVHFDLQPDGQTVHLTQEGGHRVRRILHFEDHTGAEIHRALLSACQKHPNIQIVEDHFAIDLILNKQVDANDINPNRCVGAYVLNKNSGEVSVYLAKSTILSTGGAGKVYLYTSNWSGATGDGVAIAYRAGARIANMEFMQFHPTCLFHRESRNFLISEALRGEGGELINSQGQAFMKKYHEMGSLAPRDIVARSIDAEIKKSGAQCVYLDMTKKSRDFLLMRFPVIFKKCAEYGIDMATQPIPVVPAAHYLCGGVVTDKNGQTDILGLWALGNRLLGTARGQPFGFEFVTGMLGDGAQLRYGNSQTMAATQPTHCYAQAVDPSATHGRRRDDCDYPYVGRNPPLDVELRRNCSLE